tara:strand:- start:434 stop:901 length:468 start_codon:yes stop_codon:yes gene_type:complete
MKDNSMAKRSIHRNLNAARKRPDVFVWVACTSTNKAGTFTAGSKGKKEREIHPSDGAFMLLNARLDVSVKVAAKINGGANREVGAYARGDISYDAGARPANARRITINMIKAGKADKITRGIGRGEARFVYADTHTPCPDSGLTIYADSTGMYLV